MYNNNTNGSRAAPARGFMGLFAIMLAIGLGLLAFSAEAAPFAYVTNEVDGTVSVIDTTTNPPSVVATVPLGISGPDNGLPGGVAVAPDGARAYVVDTLASRVSVIDTATNKVVGTPIPVGSHPSGIAITPDGTHAYVTAAEGSSGFVSVIDTTTNTVVAMVGMGVAAIPKSVAITPDGKHAYVAIQACPVCMTNPLANRVSVIDTANSGVVASIPVGVTPSDVAVTPGGTLVYVTNYDSGNVSVIDTATNMVVATVTVGSGPEGVAVTPDGKHAYVANFTSNNVSVIDTGTNIVGIPIPVGNSPWSVAVTPDGKHAYVTNQGSNNVSVIDTVSNMVVATVPVGGGPLGVGIIPDVPFLAFGANLVLAVGGVPNPDSFALQTRFILSSAAPAINPLIQPVTLQVGTFAGTIPPGFFVATKQGFFVFAGVINGVALQAAIEQTGTLRYAFQAKAVHAGLTGTTNPVTVRLSIGAGSGITSVNAKIFH